jgi:ABC-type branched-subunit amino acid transport system substrate-binding protein
MMEDRDKKNIYIASFRREIMKKSGMWIVGVIIVAIVVAIFVSFSAESSDTVKIGVITDLTGPAAYWGESTRVGAELAAEELREQGYDVELIFEDYQLDASKALSSAQKLVNLEDVDAIYAEFNPAAISVGSFTKDKDVLFVYDAAVVSPLEDAPNAYKTYLDYQEGCRKVSEKFKQDGIEKIGVLKVSLEFGELCLAGVEEVYDDVVIESYNLGDADFKTQILKLDSADVGAVINVGFEGDTLNTLKVIREQDLDIKYGTIDDTITQNVKDLYSDELVGGHSFGFREIDLSFHEKIQDENLATEYGAAIAYTHVMQMVKALDGCEEDLNCAIEEMDNSDEDVTIGFRRFSNRIAELDMEIKSY